MRERQKSQISENDSDEESKSTKPSTSKSNEFNNHKSSSSDSSSEEEETRAPTPPPAPKRSFSASPKKKVFGNPIDRFISENLKLVKLVVNDVISKNDDVCLLEVPKNVDPMCFMEKIINFDRRTKIKLNNCKYIIEPSHEDMKPINLLTEKLRIIHPLTILKMRENTKHKKESEAVDFESVTPSLPDNLKVRHPLFGSQYKPKILLNEEIQRKLDGAIEGALKKLKKKKHEKKKKNEEFLAPDVCDSGKKKKKQKREKLDEESGFGSAETDLGDNELNEEDLQKTEVEESIFALLESHISGKKKKSHKNECNESQVTLDLSHLKKEHKKKKDKSRSNLEENLEQSNEFIDNSYFEEHEKKMKHQSRIKEEKFNLSEDENFGKKRKRHSSIKEEKNNTQMNVDAQDSVEYDESFKSEKRKRKNSVKNNAVFLEPEDTGFIKIKPEMKNKRTSIANSTVISDLQLPLFEFDVSGITNKEVDLDSSKNEEEIGKKVVKEENLYKLKKKKKAKSFEEDDKSLMNESTEQTLNESKFNHEGGKKKKKRKHYVDDDQEIVSPSKKIKKEKEGKKGDEATNSLIFDILKKVKSEMDTTLVSKKKRKSDR